jgi:hypothetical protein
MRIATIADGLPARGDAPPKYDNNLAHFGHRFDRKLREFKATAPVLSSHLQCDGRKH